MKKPGYIISINKPCNEDWQTMSKRPTGRFCSSCSKTVTDLSNCTDAEIIKLMEANAGKICVRMKESQLNRVIQKPVEQNSKPGLFKMLAGLLLFSSANHAISKTITEKTEVRPAVNTRPESENILPTDSTKNVIRGKVLEAQTRKGRSFVTVFIENTRINTVTDKEGNFALTVPDKLPGDSFTIVASDGKQTSSQLISRKKLPATITIVLYAPEKEPEERKWQGAPEMTGFKDW